MTEYYTENLAEFGYCEIELLNEILTAWTTHGLPSEFYDSGVKPAFNKGSGYVFLVNDDYQVAMLNDDRLEIYHTLPYGGAEGFLHELIAENEPDDLHSEDVEYIKEVAASANVILDEKWLK